MLNKIFNEQDFPNLQGTIKHRIRYLAIITSKYYFCLQTLDKNTGVINNSQCAYVYKPTGNTNYRLITIS